MSKFKFNRNEDDFWFKAGISYLAYQQLRDKYSKILPNEQYEEVFNEYLNDDNILLKGENL